jgi:hypothetical protein
MTMEYKNSSAYHGTMNATTERQLLERKRYTSMAISYHQQIDNAEQVAFFTAQMKLIDKRLKRLAP